MSLRPVDLQTIIPKLPEVQKAKNAENELEKNNLSINMHKEQQQQDKNTQQIIETKKAQEARINTVSYTHLRAHETVLDLVCRLLLEKTIIKRHKSTKLETTYHKK